VFPDETGEVTVVGTKHTREQRLYHIHRRIPAQRQLVFPLARTTKLIQVEEVGAIGPVAKIYADILAKTQLLQQRVTLYLPIEKRHRCGGLAVRASLPLVRDAWQLEETAVIDSAPVPCVSYKHSKQASDFVGSADYGVCSSKALKYFGYKFHSVVSLTDLIMGFLLTAASHYDTQPVLDVLETFSHRLQHLLGDGASNDAALQLTLEQLYALRLLAPVKSNQPPQRSPQAQKRLNRWRLICETVNAQLQEQLHLSKHDAQSAPGG